MEPVPTLLFVYNADRGVFNLLTDVAHKILSPSTYQCRLCALTHNNLGMKKDWRDFLQRLPISLEFLHADEFRKQHGRGDSLPAIFIKKFGELHPLIDAEQINSCKSLSQLNNLISTTVAKHIPVVDGRGR